LINPSIFCLTIRRLKIATNPSLAGFYYFDFAFCYGVIFANNSIFQAIDKRFAVVKNPIDNQML
jgi:hypothetical protein